MRNIYYSTANIRNRNMAELSYLRASYRDIKGNGGSCMTTWVVKKNSDK